MKRLGQDMKNSVAWIGGLIILMTALILFASRHAESSDHQFYQGKVLRLVCGSGVGGGTDTYARLVARHWGRHIPGKPKVLVQNMPGGGGALAFGFLFSRARPDGLTVGVASEGVPARRLLRFPGHTYELKKMHLIAASPGSTVHYARQDLGVTSMADLTKLKKTIKLGGSHKGSTITITARLTFDLMKVDYRMVYGYSGYREALLATVKGEVNFSGGDAFIYTSSIAPAEKRGEIQVLFQSGLLDSNANIIRHPRMPKIPTVEEAYLETFGQVPSGKTWEAIRGMIAMNTFGKSFWSIPGTPNSRVRQLEDGYRKMLKSPEYQKDALKILGSKDQALVEKEAEPALKLFFSLPQEIIELYR